MARNFFLEDVALSLAILNSHVDMPLMWRQRVEPLWVIKKRFDAVFNTSHIVYSRFSRSCSSWQLDCPGSISDKVQLHGINQAVKYKITLITWLYMLTLATRVRNFAAGLKSKSGHHFRCHASKRRGNATLKYSKMWERHKQTSNNNGTLAC